MLRLVSTSVRSRLSVQSGNVVMRINEGQATVFWSAWARSAHEVVLDFDLPPLSAAE